MKDRPDGIGYFYKPLNYEKKYSLTPQQSLTTDYRVKTLQIGQKKMVYIETSIKSHLKFPIKVFQMEIKEQSNLEFLGFVTGAKSSDDPL